MSTIIIALVVTGILALAVRSIIKDKKLGKVCSGCSGECNCHKK